MALAETLAHFFAVRVLIPLLARLPQRAALGLGRGAGWLSFRVLRIRRGVTLANLRFVLGDSRSPAELEALADEAYAQFGMTVIEVLRSLAGCEDGATGAEIPDLARLEALQKEGRGAILCSPHYGSFERMAQAAAARGLRLCVMMRPLDSPRFDALIVAARGRYGIEVLQRGRVSPYALLERLGEGAMLGLLPDQNTRHGVEVDFLGRPARTYRGPAVLHLRSGAPIAVCVNRRNPEDPTRHLTSIRFLPVYEPGPDRNADIRAITQQVCDAMAEEILQAPGQYFWMHRRWGRAPLGRHGRRRRPR